MSTDYDGLVRLVVIGAAILIRLMCYICGGYDRGNNGTSRRQVRRNDEALRRAREAGDKQDGRTIDDDDAGVTMVVRYGNRFEPINPNNYAK